MNVDKRIENLLRIAELHQLTIDKLTDDVSELTRLVRKHELEMKAVHLTLSRLAEGFHSHH